MHEAYRRGAGECRRDAGVIQQGAGGCKGKAGGAGGCQERANHAPKLQTRGGECELAHARHRVAKCGCKELF